MGICKLSPQIWLFYGLNPELDTVSVWFISHHYPAMTVLSRLCSLPPKIYSWSTCLRLWSPAMNSKNYQEHILSPFKSATLLFSQSLVCDQFGACGYRSPGGVQLHCNSRVACEFCGAMVQFVCKRNFLLSSQKTMWLNLRSFTLPFSSNVGVTEFLSESITI